jgi:hypothetical protein
MPRLAPFHDRIGLGMQRDPLAGRRDDLERFQHRARRGRGDAAEGVAHIELEADDAALNQRADVLDAVFAQHRRGRNRHRPSAAILCFSASASGVPVVGSVFGMSNTVVTPPNAAAAVPLAQVFLVGIAGIAKMHVNVDRAGQDMKTGRVERLAAGGIASGAPIARITPSAMAMLAL